MPVIYSDFHPQGTTRTSTIGIDRHPPLLPDFMNHWWFKKYVEDFLWKNSLEKNGVVSGCVISQDGSNDAIACTAGEIYFNGAKTTIAEPDIYTTPYDGWYISYAKTDGTVIHGYLANETLQGAITPDDAVILGYTLRGNGIFYVRNFYNELIKTVEIEDEITNLQNLTTSLQNLTQQIHPDVIVGSSVTGRVTNLESDFVAALSAGDRLLFTPGVTLTGNRIVTEPIEVLMDDPEVRLNLDSFDLTLSKCTGFVGLTSTSGKLILDGVCNNLVVITDGSVARPTETINFDGSYYFNGKLYQKNQLLLDNDVEHVIGNQAQVNAYEATIYYDSATTSFKDRFGNVVSIVNGNRILWKGLDTLTSDIDLNGINGLTWEIDPDFTIPLLTYNLTLGSDQKGFLKVSGSGTLTIAKSDGFRVSTSGVSIDNQAGDIVINNDTTTSNISVDWKAKNIDIVNLTTVAVDVTADAIEVVSDSNIIRLLKPLDVTPNINDSGANGLDTGTKQVSTYYYVWVIAKADGTQAGLFSLSDTAPTMPAGYTFKAPVGRVYNNAGNILAPESQYLVKFVNSVKKPRITRCYHQYAAGYGSLNNKIPYFSQIQIYSNQIVGNIQNSSIDGFSITANMDCWIDLIFTTSFVSTGQSGFSLNSTNLTEPITDALNDNARLTHSSHASQYTQSSTITKFKLFENDIIRPHTNGDPSTNSPQYTKLIATLTEIIS